MRILAITPWGSMIGGANRSFLMVVSELSKTYDHQVHVILPKEGELTQELSDRDITWEVIPFQTAGVVLKGEAKDHLRKIKANIIAFRGKHTANRYAKKLSEKFDVVYINTLNAFIGYHIAEALKLPVVWHLRGAFTDKHYYVHHQEKILTEEDVNLIAISNSLRDNVQKVLRDNRAKIEVIHNGIELNNQRPSSQKTENGIQCLICGRITPPKGQLEAIKAIAELRRKGIDITLSIAGSAPNGETDTYLLEIKKYCTGNHITDSIIFLGQIDDMPALRESMNIELVCSECEPFGRCTVEAMQSRLIVIAANTGGTLDIIQDGLNGFLYQQGDYLDLAQKIQDIIEHYEESFSVADYGYEFAKTHFTVKENVKQINTLLLKTGGHR